MHSATWRFNAADEVGVQAHAVCSRHQERPGTRPLPGARAAHKLLLLPAGVPIRARHLAGAQLLLKTPPNTIDTTWEVPQHFYGP